MASPHVAGLVAYLLSLYPFEQFDPPVSPDLASQTTFSLSSLYAFTHASLPSWVVSFLQPPRLVQAATAPVKRPLTLTPIQLKTAVVELASKGVLSDLPPKTANLLIFNNATVA